MQLNLHKLQKKINIKFKNTNLLYKSMTHKSFDSIKTDYKVAKVSAIGVGMRSQAGVAQKMFETLGKKNINIQAISTSEIKISVLIHEDSTELAVRSLHSTYGLDS